MISLLLFSCAKSGEEDSGSAKDCGNFGRVTYSANGATSGSVPGDQCVASGSIFSVGGNDGNLVKPGFAFTSWNTKADGTGINYSGSYQALSNGTLTLYARWVVGYSVTYDANGSTAGVLPRGVAWHSAGSSITTLANTGALAKPGSVFAGWNTQSDGSGTSYLNGTTFTMPTSNVTLYVRWSTPYTVSYDANGASSGSAPTDSGSYGNGVHVTLLQRPADLLRTGFSFTGWNTQADGAGTTYSAGGLFTMPSANVILYARWRELFTVTYNGNYHTAGTVPVNSNSYIQGVSVSTAANSLTRDGYNFGGWNTQADGSGTNYNPSTSFPMPAGNVTLYANWTRTNKQWNSIAASNDGAKLVGSVYAGHIYTSTDSGVTWRARDSVRNWRAVASSGDGTKLVALVDGGQIYTSVDSGVTWTPRESARAWQSIASSSDGTQLVAAVYGGQLYTSTDSGATWIARDSSRYWSSVASSGDGTKLVALVQPVAPALGQIYTSTDSGVTWTPRESSRSWFSVASSNDGIKLIAVVYGGQIYTSIDSGVSWTARESNRNWARITSSSDGTKLVAVVSGASPGGQIYTSADSGVTWTARESNRHWNAVACSTDGTKVFAGVYNGLVYSSADSGATWQVKF